MDAEVDSVIEVAVAASVEEVVIEEEAHQEVAEAAEVVIEVAEVEEEEQVLVLEPRCSFNLMRDSLESLS
mgnify:CR=1 FL=1